jgi:RNA polymerase sigma-70 factor (ECF subfamily)
VRLAESGTAGPGVPQELLRTLYPKVRGWASSLTPDGDAADDVTQEVLLRVWRRAGTFRGGCRFQSWVYAVTRNAALDYHRKEARQRRAQRRHRPRKVVDPRPRLAAREHLERTLGLLERLPADQRAAVALATAGFTSAEAAERMGVRPGTVRARLCRARAALLETRVESPARYLSSAP